MSTMGRLLWVLLLLVPAVPAGAQPKPAPSSERPRVAVVAPLGAVPGTTTRLTIRGSKLDTATEVRFPGFRAPVKILSKGKAVVPRNQDAATVGDTQVEAQVKLPRAIPAGAVAFVVVTPAGTSPPHPLVVDDRIPVAAEKEPNNGFRQAQAVAVPGAVDGSIGRPDDVDVFRFEGRAGERLVVEVLAARYGSALDSILTLYDADGYQVAANDDAAGSLDSRLEWTVPRTGGYYLSLMDAHGQGGPAHVYRLVIRARPAGAGIARRDPEHQPGRPAPKVKPSSVRP